MRTALRGAAFLMGLGATAMPAMAAPNITEVITIETQLAYQPPDPLMGGSIFVGTQENLTFTDGPAQLGLQLSTTLGTNGSFFFLHNLYVQGNGSANMATQLDIAITNNGTEAANLRLDSLITPGFIGFQGSQIGNASVSFDFLVRQVADHPFAGPSTTLYSANGRLTASDLLPNAIQTSDNNMFTGFTSYSAPGRVAYEWGATPLNLTLLPIPAGATHYIQYFNETAVVMQNGICVTQLGCDGVQVAFGDPRNDGSVGSLSASFSDPDNNQPLIGRLFNATTYSTADITEPFAPLPDPDLLPPPAPPPNYNWLPPVDALTGGIPEPESWLMLISGFGLIGAMQRRQRPRTA